MIVPFDTSGPPRHLQAAAAVAMGVVASAAVAALPLVDDLERPHRPRHRGHVRSHSKRQSQGYSIEKEVVPLGQKSEVRTYPIKVRGRPCPPRGRCRQLGPGRRKILHQEERRRMVSPMRLRSQAGIIRSTRGSRMPPHRFPLRRNEILQFH